MDYEFVNNGEEFVFFLHGWGGDKNSFSFVKNHTIKDCSMVFVSFSGFGDSKEPKKPYSVSDYANELKILIDKLAKDKKINIVCHSFGARVASVFCANNPQRVNKLFIVDGAGIKPRRSLNYYIKVWRFKTLKKKVIKGKLNKSVLNKYGSQDYKNLSGIMKKTFVCVVNEDLKKYFKQIRCKTFIYFGEKDSETPVYMAKKMHKLIKNSELFIAKGLGHFSFLEDKDAFIYHLNRFLF